jgi:drug/metabolite transporter (DMT)-like permease
VSAETGGSTEPSPMARALPVLLALGGAWGCSFLFIEVIVEDTGALELVLGRLFFGSLTVGGYMVVTRHPVRANRGLFVPISVMALVGMVIPFALIAWGQEHIESGTTSVLNSAVPVFTAVFAAIAFADERFTAGRLLGLGLAIAGVLALTGEDIVDVTDSAVLGQLAVVAAGVCFGLVAVIARNLLKDQDPVNLSMLQLSLATVYAVPLVFLFSGGAPDYRLDVEAWASLVALGAIGAGFAYIAYLWLIEHIGSVRASLVTYIVPIIAVFLGWIVLDESIGLNTIAGGGLIIAGVASVMRGQVPVREVREAVPAAVGE